MGRSLETMQLGDVDLNAYLLIVVFWSKMVPATSQDAPVNSMFVCWIHHSLSHQTCANDLVALRLPPVAGRNLDGWKGG
jgi:hypothetical protein